MRIKDGIDMDVYVIEGFVDVIGVWEGSKVTGVGTIEYSNY